MAASNSVWLKLETKEDAHQLVGQAKRRSTKIRPKVVGSGFGRFANVDKCRLEVAAAMSYLVWL